MSKVKTKKQKIQSSIRELNKIEKVMPVAAKDKSELVIESLYDVDPAFLRKDLVKTILATLAVVGVLVILVNYFK